MSSGTKPPEIPRISRRLVSFTVPRQHRDDVLDDLAEGFETVLSSTGAARARWFYRKQALCLVLHYSFARAIDVTEACAFLYRMFHWMERLLEWFKGLGL
jgi:hypothetical protein